MNSVVEPTFGSYGKKLVLTGSIELHRLRPPVQSESVLLFTKGYPSQYP